MSKKTLKQYINEVAEQEDYPRGSKSDLYETFTEYGLSEGVWIGDADEHRWYTNYPCVYKVVIDSEERFFKYHFMRPDGDNSAEDCGWEDPDLDELKEVYPYEKTVILYK